MNNIGQKRANTGRYPVLGYQKKLNPLAMHGIFFKLTA